MKTLSVIVPVYNTEKYLKNCLDSILKQTYKDFEIIVINDGSTDKSQVILDEYVKMCSARFKVINQDNHGIGFTRNKGIELAKGKYICFIDSDDTIEPTYCEKMVNAMEKLNLDLAVCDYYEVDEKTCEKSYLKINDFKITNLKEEPCLFFDINISPWNKIYKTQLIRSHKIRFPEDLKYEDTLFVLKYLCIAENIGKINEPLVNYLIREGGETKTLDKKVFDIFVILKEIKEYLMEVELYETVHEYLEWFFINRITVYSIQQRYQKDWKVAKKFIEEGYKILEDNFPNWRYNNQFLKNNGYSKRMLKGNMILMKIFVRFTKKGNK